MYKVEINVDPAKIGHGLLCHIIDKAIREYFITSIKEDLDQSLVKVTYEGHKEQV